MVPAAWAGGMDLEAGRRDGDAGHRAVGEAGPHTPSLRFVRHGELAAVVTDAPGQRPSTDRDAAGAADDAEADSGGPGTRGATGDAEAATASSEARRRGQLRLHARVLEALLVCRAVVPAPLGLRARDEAAVRRLLERAALPLAEALDYVEDSYEVRVHVVGAREGRSGAPAGDPGVGTGAPEAAPEAQPVDVDQAGAPAALLADGPDGGAAAGMSRGPAAAADLCLSELGRRARAVRRLPPAPGALRSRAFLVPRPDWVAFVEEAAEWEARHPGLELDVTGPWPPYDFVRWVREPEGD